MYPGLTGAKAGAIQNVQVRGAAVGSGVPVFSLGFDGAYDQTAGVANITMAGETGDQGDPGTGTGPPGAQGAPGVGFTTSSIWNPKYWVSPGDGATVLTHSHNFGATIKYLHGGHIFWQRMGWLGWPIFNWVPFYFWRNSDYFDITQVYRSGTSNEIGVIDDTYHATSDGGTYRGLFLNGAT